MRDQKQMSWEWDEDSLKENGRPALSYTAEEPPSEV